MGLALRGCLGDNTMSTDYDAPRRTETDDVSEDRTS
jgi:hypothetical protein